MAGTPELARQLGIPAGATVAPAPERQLPVVVVRLGAGLARQLGRSWPGAAAAVLDGWRPAAAAAPGARWAAAGGGVAGRAGPPAGDHGRGPAAAWLPSGSCRWWCGWVRARPPAGDPGRGLRWPRLPSSSCRWWCSWVPAGSPASLVILVGGPRRPGSPIGGCRCGGAVGPRARPASWGSGRGPAVAQLPSGSCRWWCGWVPELARQLGDLGRGLRRPWFPIGGCRWWCGWAPELARQLGIMAGARGGLVLDGRQPVAGEGGAPELARQLGRSWPGARGGRVLDGRQPVAGEGGAPELARQLGRSWPGARGGRCSMAGGLRRPAAPRCSMGGSRWRWLGAPELARQLGIMAGACGGLAPRAAVAGGGAVGCRSSPASWGSRPGACGGPGSRAAVAGGGAVGCRSSPASLGDLGRRPAAAPVPDRRLPVVVQLGPGLARQLGDHGRGPRRPGARWAAAGGGSEGGAPELARQLGRSWPGARGGRCSMAGRPAAAAAPGARWAAAGGGVAGPRSWPASWGIMAGACGGPGARWAAAGTGAAGCWIWSQPN